MHTHHQALGCRVQASKKGLSTSSCPNYVTLLSSFLRLILPLQVRLLLLAAMSGEHILYIGPPGTAKSELGRRLAALYDGSFFERLLTRFSVPEVSCLPGVFPASCREWKTSFKWINDL